MSDQVMGWIALYNAQKLELRKLNAAILRKNAQIARLKEKVSPSGEGEGRRGKVGNADTQVSEETVSPSVSSTTPSGRITGDAGVASGPLTPVQRKRRWFEKLKEDPERYQLWKDKEKARKRVERGGG